MNQPEKLNRYLIALLQVPGIGVSTARHLVRMVGHEHVASIFSLPPSKLASIDGIGEVRARNILKFDDWKAVDDILKKTEAVGAQLVSYRDEDYPAMLRQTYDAPLLLWVLGDRSALNKPAIAVVGTRSPSRYGAKQASEWTEKLIHAGLAVNSGLAYGVDAIAHRTTVEEGGCTTAVLGSGVDWIYPDKNRAIAKRMIDSGGAVITEYPPGTKPDAGNFPERNRIVSGMSYGTLVIESGRKGGSMITARLALDQNRDVFVVPHALDSAKGEGNNWLIKRGLGKLVQTVEDVLDELPVDAQPTDGKREEGRHYQQIANELSEEQQRLCGWLQENELHIDELCARAGEPTHKLLPALLELEMIGVVRQKAGKYFELC
ncbi:MAG: DNA-processing protein DprA [Balneolaceae bacterium]